MLSLTRIIKYIIMFYIIIFGVVSLEAEAQTDAFPKTQNPQKIVYVCAKYKEVKFSRYQKVAHVETTSIERVKFLRTLGFYCIKKDSIRSDRPNHSLDN